MRAVTTFSTTLGGSVVLSGILFGGFSYYNYPDIAHTSAALPLFAAPHIYEAWEKYLARRDLEQRRCSRVATFDGFAMRWYFLAICGVFVVCGIMEVLGVVIHSPLSDPDKRFRLEMAGPPVAVLAVILIYLLGSWTGMRSGKYGMIALVASTLLGPIVANLFDYTVSVLK